MIISEFQHTLPCRERQGWFKNGDCTLHVSTHAPMQGATAIAEVRLTLCARFQHTLPCRERREPFASSSYSIIGFNSRSHVGSDDRRYTTSKSTESSFNSRSHVGSDDGYFELCYYHTICFNSRSHVGSDAGTTC